jgi:hypothetical protein
MENSPPGIHGHALLEVFQTVASYWVCFAVNSGRVESVTLAASEAAITEEPTEGDETPAEEAVRSRKTSRWS